MYKSLLILVLSFLVIPTYAQVDYIRTICQNDTSNFWAFSAIIRPVRDTITGLNKWETIDDVDHLPINCSTVVTEVGGVTVYFSETCHKIGSVVVSPDESTVYSTHAKIKSTDPLFGEGGYKCGVRVFKNRAVVYFSKPGCRSFTFTRDSVGNTWSKGVYSPLNMQSDVNKISITQGYNYIDIKLDSLFAMSNIPRFDVRCDPNFPQYILDVRVRRYSLTWMRIMITDPRNSGAIVPVSQYPEGMQLYSDFGEVDIPVNALTEKFSSSANFWMMGILKGVDE